MIHRSGSIMHSARNGAVISRPITASVASGVIVTFIAAATFSAAWLVVVPVVSMSNPRAEKYSCKHPMTKSYKNLLIILLTIDCCFSFLSAIFLEHNFAKSKAQCS